MILSSTRSTHARSRPSGRHNGRSGDRKSTAKSAARFEPRQRTLAHSQRRHLNQDSSIGFSATNAEGCRPQANPKRRKSKRKATRVRTTPNSLAVMIPSGHHGAAAAAVTKTLAREEARKATATASASRHHPLTPPTTERLDAFICSLILKGRADDAVAFLMQHHGMSRGDARGYVIDVELPKMEELPKSPPLVAIQKDTKEDSDRSPTGVRDLALVTPDDLSLLPPVLTDQTPNDGGGNGLHVLETIIQGEEDRTVLFGEGSDYYFQICQISPPIFKVENRLSSNTCKLAPSTDDKLYGLQFLDDRDEECEYESFDDILPRRPPQNIFACILQALQGAQW